MPKRYTPEVKARAVDHIMERLDRYRSVYAACNDMAPKLNVGKETLRRWVLQAQVDSGERTGSTSEELAEIKALKAKVRDLEEANDILKASAIFFARESVISPYVAQTGASQGFDKRSVWTRQSIHLHQCGLTAWFGTSNFLSPASARTSLVDHR